MQAKCTTNNSNVYIHYKNARCKEKKIETELLTDIHTQSGRLNKVAILCIYEENKQSAVSIAVKISILKVTTLSASNR